MKSFINAVTCSHLLNTKTRSNHACLPLTKNQALNTSVGKNVKDSNNYLFVKYVLFYQTFITVVIM